MFVNLIEAFVININGNTDSVDQLDNEKYPHLSDHKKIYLMLKIIKLSN